MRGWSAHIYVSWVVMLHPPSPPPPSPSPGDASPSQDYHAALVSAIEEVEKSHWILLQSHGEASALRARLAAVTRLALFAALDSDRDGRVSRREYAAALDPPPLSSSSSSSSSTAPPTARQITDAAWDRLCGRAGCDPARGLTAGTQLGPPPADAATRGAAAEDSEEGGAGDGGGGGGEEWEGRALDRLAQGMYGLQLPSTPGRSVVELPRSPSAAASATPGSLVLSPSGPGAGAPSPLGEQQRAGLRATVRGVLREMVSTEQAYVGALQELVEDFYRPLLDSSFSVEGAIIPSEQVWT
eukprot:COSAG01_NODE_74_length_28433_cov_41.582269_3_plen_299_part_00